MRWRVERDRVSKKFGLELTTESGCLGSTYGEIGRDMYRKITLTLLKWTFVFRSYWKEPFDA